ncbi:MAG: AAA family ATPase [Erysipelotrichaceae bacterium]|nr:AAA family ATPase [Erysipelotrichaceae bacterium]
MNDELLDSLDGCFVYTIYRSESYMVSKFETDEGTITVTGPSFDYVKGEKYTLSGTYTDHPKYGFQFNILAINKYIPSKKEEIIRFLSGAAFKGVGKKAASKIYEAFGDECLRIIREDISVLDDLNLTSKQLAGIKEGIESLGDDDNDTILLLISSSFSNSEARRIYFHYKEDTVFVLENNPYRFYLDVYSIPFSKVLECARNLEFSDKEHKFKEAYLVYIFKEISFNTGNTYLEREDFEYEYTKNYSDFDEILDICITDKEIIEEDGHYYYKQEYYDEKYIADYLKTEKEGLTKDDSNIADAIAMSENSLNISYDTDQKEAITSFFKEDFSLIVGGPGTGKTTLIKAMVGIFREFFPYQNIMVVAPTGRAAKRINEMCDVESKTIHSLLKWNKESNTFIHKIDNPILYDCLIIDEFSMVDNNLFASLLKACHYVKKICVIGDANQLPSIRQGNLLKDLIDCGRFRITYLKCNHRQKEGNSIISLANDIVDNDVDFDRYNKDVSFYDINGFSISELIDMIAEDLDNGSMLDDIQILSPMYRGEYGIDNLNITLQASFNPRSKDKKERKFGKITFRENDKILQLKNRPVDDVYNGDIGILEEIDEEDKCLVVDYQNVKVFYEFSDVSDISLAYTLSVHKAQGSEYGIVYFICSRMHMNMLYKQLIYTAISRAKNKLVIIGDMSAFLQGTRRLLGSRKTGLLKRLID